MACKRCTRLKMVCFADRWNDETDMFRSHATYPIPYLDMGQYALDSIGQDWFKRMV